MKKILLFTSAALLIAFVLFTDMVRRDVFLTQSPMGGVDFDLTVKLQNNVPARLDPLLELMTTSASAPVIGLILLVVLGVLYRSFGALVIFVAWGGGQLLELVLKNMLRQPGPPFQFQRIHTAVNFDKDYQLVGYSYPSGHSFRVVFLVIVATFLVARRYGWSSKSAALTAVATSGFATVVMVAKVVHGGHWTTDIVGGALLGGAAACASLVFVSLPKAKKNAPVTNDGA